MITIVNYGTGNLASIQNMLSKIGAESEISSDAEHILHADQLILPGVGAFDSCAAKLRESGLMEALETAVLKQKKNTLGICVGMQLLLEGSEEGQLPGLGWIKGKNIGFRQKDSNINLKIPHMGWTEIRPHKESPLFSGLEQEARFYFVHSYHAQLPSEEDILAYADYGYPFAAAIQRNNILGVQFHPEKSHKFGMQLLDNFVKNFR